MVALESQNIAPTPEIEWPLKTAASDIAPDRAEPLQASTPMVTLETQNIAPTTKTEQPPQRAVPDIGTIDRSKDRNRGNSTITSTPEAPEPPTEPGSTATTTERAADSQACASVLQRAQPTAKALRALPDIIRFENEAATALLNKDPVELQQLANLRYQQCKHVDTALK